MVMFVENMGVKVICVNVEDKFFGCLVGVVDLEEKCKIIGCIFIEVFDEEVIKL